MFFKLQKIVAMCDFEKGFYTLRKNNYGHTSFAMIEMISAYWFDVSSFAENDLGINKCNKLIFIPLAGYYRVILNRKIPCEL